MTDGLQPRGQKIAGTLLGAISSPTAIPEMPVNMTQLQTSIIDEARRLTQPMQSLGAPSTGNFLNTDAINADVASGVEQLARSTSPVFKMPPRPDLTEKKSGGLLSGLKNFVRDPAAMAQMAIAFNSMRLKPDQGLAQSMQNVIERQGLIRSGNATEQALRNVGTEVALKYADAIAANPTEAANLYKAYLQEVSQKPQETFRTLSDAEKIGLGLSVDGTYQISNLTNKVSAIGGSGDEISINMPGDEPEFGREAAKAGAEYYTNLAKGAPTLTSQYSKLQDTKNLLKEGKPSTGIFAEVKLNLDRLLASMGDEEAALRATDTQYLNALLGSDVFPLIASLGIGARGLDTPEERKFLQEVMTGQVSNELETLEKMTRYRENYVLQAIEAYNKALETEGFKSWKKSAKIDLQPIETDVSTRPNNVPQDKSDQAIIISVTPTGTGGN